MAFRFVSKRIPANLASRSPSRFYSQAAAASAAAAASQLNTQPTSTLPNLDPADGSQSASLVNEHAPYMVATYSRPPPVFVRGRGSYLWDLEDRKYLDLTAGIAVTGLGHCDPEVADILADQARTLIHTSNLYHNPWTLSLSKLLVDKTKSGHGMHDATAAFICNSGSEANEAAIKFARKVGKVLDPSGAKTEIVSFANAFHGRTMGSLSATHNPKYQEPFAPMVPGFVQGQYNDVAGLADLVTERTCGVLVEPIQGEGGVRVADEAFLVALARRCRKVGAVLIHDEIQCGLARTGRLWAHSALPAEAHPDVVTTAKALGNGFPIGATIVNARVADRIKVGDHGTTYGGNPLACRLAHHVLSRLADPDLQVAVMAKGAVLASGLNQLWRKYPALISEIRGRGLILGLQLTSDPTPILAAARERGLLLITAAQNTIRFVPSLTISEAEIQEGLGILDQAIASTQAS
ncbi:acetylornithine aminotransferase [Magnaporthiopsis poae ATCC 64411]|uniref:acetylornithine transaminase n=1 Tax=Magnaporthiopsis poae (strain ATCC 64411 / 73-15) TaxID=644358 RepID=A0A0C4DM09_MAGP6|nr:acetylornithine aminotransferase [Magnaporthiopsis poae ATCC 64411]